MRIIRHIIYTAATLLLTASCGDKTTISTDDFTEKIFTPQHASGFEIRGDGKGNTLLAVSRPWQGDGEMPEQKLLILRSGDAKAAAEYDGQTITGAARRVVCMSSSHVAMLDAIDCADRIAGVSGKRYITNLRISGSDKVCDVGYDPNLDFERIVSLRPDIVLLYGVAGENTATTAKLRELGIPYLYIGDYAEQTPLGKAEWLVAVSEIVGCREHATQVFDAIETRYTALRDSIAQASQRRPSVMLNTPYQDVWYMPSDDSYMVRLIEDAGGRYIYSGENPAGGSRAIGLEEAYMLVTDADLWLNTGQCTDMEELRQSTPKFVSAGVFRSGRIYNNNRRRTAAGGNDFWESAVVHPDVVLRDLATIIGGGEEPLYYYQRLE